MSATALTGTISSSSIALTGTGTLFTTELAVGALVFDPTQHQIREVIEITSNTAARIKSAFSSPLSASTIYTGVAALYRNFKKHSLKKELDLTADAIKAILVTSSYVFNQSHEFVSDLGANILKRVALTSVTVDVPNPGTVDCDDHVFATVNGAYSAIVYADTQTGVDATSPLIYFTELVAGFPGSTTNGNVNITVDSGNDRLFTL